MSEQKIQKLLVEAQEENEASENLIVSKARMQLSQHEHFRCHSDSIGIDCKKGRLVLIGRLPSFYLKQVLQTVLRGLPGVSRIDNRVDVVSPTGLSSAKSQAPRKGQPA